MNIATRKIDYALDNEELNHDLEISEMAYVPENRVLEAQHFVSQYNWNQPYVDAKDKTGVALAVVMTLGPLAAYAAGFGV